MNDEARALLDQMVGRLVQRRFVQTAGVERAFRSVARHLFLPGVPLDEVYSGEGIVTRRRSDGLPCSSSSDPGVMACMVEQLRLEPAHRVLEIGAGTGYNAAILATLVGREGHVTTVDLDEDISVEAAANLARAGVKNVRVMTRDGWLGVREAAPFDRIEATASIWDLSPHWHAQLAEGGVLLVPLILRAGLQALVAFHRDGQGFRSESVGPGGFMRLRGPHGGPQVSAPVDGWRYITDELTPERADTLSRVLREEPRVEIAPPFHSGWFTRVALADPYAIWMTHTEGWYASRVGVFIAERESLAVVQERYKIPESVRLLAFGDDTALVRLREWLQHPSPLDVRHLHFRAVPARSATSAEMSGVLVLRRPTFDIVIRYPNPRGT